MTLQLNFDSTENQTINFINELEEFVTISEFIEFTHDQTEEVSDDTFNNISLNDRILTFDITTEVFFPNDGWYTYRRYTDNTKTSLIEIGKCYLDSGDDNIS